MVINLNSTKTGREVNSQGKQHRHLKKNNNSQGSVHQSINLLKYTPTCVSKPILLFVCLFQARSPMALPRHPAKDKTMLGSWQAERSAEQCIQDEKTISQHETQTIEHQLQ